MDKIYYNGIIHSLDLDDQTYTAMGIEEGKITFLGGDDQAKEIEAAEHIDLSGKVMLPGFIDSHLHLLNYAFVSDSYKMFDVDSVGRVIDEGKALARQMDDETPCQWLYGRGWNQQKFTDEKRFLTRQDLDQISTERPILLIRVCGHVAAVNTKAMDIVMSLPNAKDYMEQINEDKGILTEASVKLCYNAMTKPTVEKIKEMILKVQKEFNRYGITSVESDNFLSLPGRDWGSIIDAHQELEEEGRLTVRIREQASFTDFNDMKDFIDQGWRTGQGGDFYSIGPIKLYEDGSLGGRTALLNEPYSGEEDDCGQMVHNPNDLQDYVNYAYAHDMQILIHAIGDRASDLVCTAYENAIEKYGEKESRLAINHLQVVSKGLFERMKKNGILAYIQPVFLGSDKEIIDDIVGPERAKLSYNWKSMLDAGLVCCGGSDAPVEDFNVLAGIRAAVTRDGPGEITKGWRPEEKVFVADAIRLFTINNAYGAFAEGERGTLEIGKLADAVILDRDPFAVEPHEIADIEVLCTMVGGTEVYRATTDSSGTNTY